MRSATWREHAASPSQAGQPNDMLGPNGRPRRTGLTHPTCHKRIIPCTHFTWAHYVRSNEILAHTVKHIFLKLPVGRYAGTAKQNARYHPLLVAIRFSVRVPNGHHTMRVRDMKCRLFAQAGSRPRDPRDPRISLSDSGQGWTTLLADDSKGVHGKSISPATSHRGGRRAVQLGSF